MCIEGYNVDIVTFDLSEKLPYFLKRGPITEAIKKGMMFEITYNEMVSGVRSYICHLIPLDLGKRRMALANAIIIATATKGKNLIVSSSCREYLYHRSPYDIGCMY